MIGMSVKPINKRPIEDKCSKPTHNSINQSRSWLINILFYICFCVFFCSFCTQSTSIFNFPYLYFHMNTPHNVHQSASYPLGFRFRTVSRNSIHAQMKAIYIQDTFTWGTSHTNMRMPTPCKWASFLWFRVFCWMSCIVIFWLHYHMVFWHFIQRTLFQIE